MIHQSDRRARSADPASSPPETQQAITQAASHSLRKQGSNQRTDRMYMCVRVVRLSLRRPECVLRGKIALSTTSVDQISEGDQEGEPGMRIDVGSEREREMREEAAGEGEGRRGSSDGRERERERIAQPDTHSFQSECVCVCLSVTRQSRGKRGEGRQQEGEREKARETKSSHTSLRQPEQPQKRDQASKGEGGMGW